MAKTRRNNVRKNKSRRGGGYLTDQQYFDPDVLPPSSLMPPLSSAPIGDDIRPVMISTAPSSELMAGGARRRRTRRSRGGFAPSVMGSFIANAQAAIVPAALYFVYNQVAKPGSNSVATTLKKAFRGGRKTRRSTRRAH